MTLPIFHIPGEKSSKVDTEKQMKAKNRFDSKLVFSVVCLGLLLVLLGTSLYIRFNSIEQHDIWNKIEGK